MPEMKCPVCGSQMILRLAKRGANAGTQFWGCSNYPKCTKTLPYTPALSQIPKQQKHIKLAVHNQCMNPIIEYEETVNVDFNGTVLDIETIGDFDKRYKNSNKSKEYANLKQIIFGYIQSKHIRIYCATNESGISELCGLSSRIIGNVARPYYAFNCSFESGVWFHHVGLTINFDGELQAFPFERKEEVVVKMDIPNYDDPFHGIGEHCIDAWNNKNYHDAIAHNRACLLKERDILIKRSCREPECLIFES